MKHAGIETRGRDNCFDIIRHFAAFLVLFSHHFALSGMTEPGIPRLGSVGFVGVAIFFAISGYFMPKSYENSIGFLDFMGKRCRRIFPGLIVCSFVMVYVLGAIITKSDFLGYMFAKDQFKTFAHFVALNSRNIKDVFSDFILPNALNGSLWTLPIEFACYIIIGFALSLRYSWRTVAILLSVCCLATATFGSKWTELNFYTVSGEYLTFFGISFFLGALLSLTEASWRPYRLALAVTAIVLLLMARGNPEVKVLGIGSIAFLTILVGSSFGDRILKGRFDISYGMYIYAFPVQQVVINYLAPGFWPGMLISLCVTCILAYFSYRYVERPFMTKRSKVLQVQEP